MNSLTLGAVASNKQRSGPFALGLRKLSRDGARYLVASLTALACDLAVYASFLKFGLVPSLAGAIGYVVGLFIHYAIASSWVFPDVQGRRTMPTFAKFLVSGLLGLILTAAIIDALTRSDLAGAFAAKAIAVGASWTCVFLMRRAYVFGCASRA